MKLRPVIIAVMLFFTLTGFTQNNQTVTDDFGRIAIVPYVPEQVVSVPIEAVNNLQIKMAQILTKHGIAGSTGYASQFVMVPNISITDKQVLASAPPKVVLTLDVAFIIGDGVNGEKFGSSSMTLKGVGSTEAKAYINAFKSIQTGNKELEHLITLSKNRILSYYNDGCDFIMKETESMVLQNRFDEALYKLVSVPVVSKDCYNKAQDQIGVVYKKKIDRDCEVLLNRATNAWNAGLDYDAAVEATGYLNQIEPAAKCYKMAQSLSNKIKDGVNRATNRDWAFLDKQLDGVISIEKARLATEKELALAYVKSLPQQVVYQIKGWW
jgi:hypothetical protein